MSKVSTPEIRLSRIILENSYGQIPDTVNWKVNVEADIAGISEIAG